MKGEVERVWKNRTFDGREYCVIQVNGEKYSLWDDRYFDRIQEGQEIEFDFRDSGDFKNITRIGEPSEQQPFDRTDYDQERQNSIIKMSCLKSAAQILSGSKIPYKNRADRAIEIARKFEKYINDEELNEDSFNLAETSDE